MKKLFLVSLLFSSLVVSAQQHIPRKMTTAKVLLVKNSALYNPTEAFRIYMEHATANNSEAMNIVGKLYAIGEGTDINLNESINWFQKAANHGYAKAWYNLGTIHKYGTGVKQNFLKAYECYSKGATLNDASSLYGQGFMLYKGLGCKQNYSEAVACFKKSAKLREMGAMYMLGLSYRNGYGVKQNSDSAKYWLNLSAKNGYKFAVEELKLAQPENIKIEETLNIVLNPEVDNKKVDLKKGYKKIKHKVSTDNIAGDYIGKLIRFDWSGTHIISASDLKISLVKDGKNLSGEWVENDVAIAKINASVTDSSLIFSNSFYQIHDHYNQITPNSFEIQNAQLNIENRKDSVFIAGNIHVYSLSAKEPEKPTFIILIKSDSNLKDQSKFPHEIPYEADELSFSTYPNPFDSQLKVKYSLKTVSNVNIVVTSVLTGNIVYKSTHTKVQPGDQLNTISFSAPTGYYVINLQYGNKLKSNIVYKF